MHAVAVLHQFLYTVIYKRIGAILHESSSLLFFRIRLHECLLMDGDCSLTANRFMTFNKCLMMSTTPCAFTSQLVQVHYNILNRYKPGWDRRDVFSPSFLAFTIMVKKLKNEY